MRHPSGSFSPGRPRPQGTVPGLGSRGWLALLALALGLGLAFAASSVDAIERQPLNTAILATVRVIVPVADEPDAYSTGSGTVLDDQAGLILTNYHVMGDMETRDPYNREGLAAIAVTPPDLRGNAVIRYWARMVKGDPDLDLALLQIIAPFEDTEAPLPEDLGLVAIPIGDSQALQFGDELNIIGFPGVGGSSVTFTAGLVAGFADEDGDGYAEWIKTDAEINRGNSGGLAANAAGEFVGVPTQARTDIGAINLIRDGNLALEFARDLSMDEGADQASRDPDAPFVAKVTFAKAIDAAGNPQGVGVRFPSGTDVLYATFEYGNFQEGDSFEYIWRRDGFQIFQDKVVWRFGKEGATWVNVFQDGGLEDGYYELEMLLEGEPLFRDGVVIGDAAPPGQGSFGPITFAAGVSDDDQPVDPGTVFSDVKEVYAFFRAEGMENGTVWSRKWYLDDELVAEKEAVWNGAEEEETWLSIVAKEKLPVGRYRLELFIEGERVQSGRFDVAAPEEVADEPEPVLVVGRIVEAGNKRRGVEGATVLFLNPGVTVDEFLDDPKDSLVYAGGISDEDGYYQLDRKLVPGSSFSVVVFHKQYKLIAVDDFQIDPEATSPYEVNITMKRR